MNPARPAINSEQAFRRIQQLRETIHYHNQRYYGLNRPEISDFAFDMLLKELESLEKEFPQFADSHSPTQRIGSDLSSDFKQADHSIPMLSLSNTYSETEVLEFIQRLRKSVEEEKPRLSAELKFDGTSISLIYSNGKLKQAITRGDGTRGDDVTENVKTIRSIPLVLQGNHIPPFLIARGEIILPIEVFQQLNREREEAGEAPFANPRNAAAGTLKLQKSAEVAKRKLDCYIYSLHIPDPPASSHSNLLKLAIQLGFKVSPYNIVSSHPEEILSYLRHWERKRKELAFEIDGIVLKADDLGVQEQLGSTAKSPRWATAFKFKAETALSQLLSIDFQVGRTGAITPVANLEPVLLAGTTVKRASLHNADQIEALDIRIGDYLMVEKGGEIIPKVVGVDTSQRAEGLPPFKFLSSCPACGTPLIRQEGEAQHYCPNTWKCPSQIRGRIEHFISRKAMNIDGLGSETIDTLVSLGLISDAGDLYSLREGELAPMERLGEKSEKNILQAIRSSKDTPFHRLLFALGIRFVGETVAKKIARALPSLEAIRNASPEELQSIEEVGGKVAESIRQFFNQEPNLVLIRKLEEAGIKMEAEVSSGPRSQILAGKSFVVSGVFPGTWRADLGPLIEAHGGKKVESISSKTDFVIAGDQMGPAKRQKAEQLKIPIIDLQAFLTMIGSEVE